MNTAELQRKLDGMAYPPTHTYDLSTLEPTGVLAERVKLILGLCPNLFEADSFLDIGCSKGWFTLKAAKTAKRVLSIDVDQRAVALLRDIVPENVDLRHCSFGALDTRRAFRHIFMGNCLHYLYRDARGWSFIDKLADLACGKVVIEAPTGMDCADMDACIPTELRCEFNETAFMGAMSKYFVLEARCPSVSYSPDRHIMVFKNEGRVHKTMPDREMKYESYLKSLYRRIKRFVSPSDTVVEVCCRHDRGVLSREIIPHKEFLCVDRDKDRPGVNIDVRLDPTPECDVLISTAIMHHTAKQEWDAVLRNLTQRTRRAVFLSGPNEDVTPEVYGDHEAHLDPDCLADMAQKVGWKVNLIERVGLSYPLCELFFALGRP